MSVSGVNNSSGSVPMSSSSNLNANSNVESLAKKIVRTIGNILSTLGLYTFKAAVAVTAFFGIGITLGAPLSLIAFPLHLMVGGGIAFAIGKSLENSISNPL